MKMKLIGKDRTAELERGTHAFRVNSEDTCAFWKKNTETVLTLRRCHYCAFYEPQADRSSLIGYCNFKELHAAEHSSPPTDLSNI